MRRSRRDTRGQPPSSQPERPKTVVVSGPVRSVVYAKRANGSEPAREFYESLSKKDQLKFDTLFALIAQTGRIRLDEKFHPNVYVAKCEHKGHITIHHVGEFKIHSGAGFRIMACQNGREWVLTHGFQKGSNVATEGRRAQLIFCEDRDLRLQYSEIERRI
jgi:hypothetical protein